MRGFAARAGLALTVAAAAPAAEPPRSWQKRWTVTGIIGSPASVAGMQEWVGKPVVLTPDHAETPVSEPCATGAPIYSDVVKRPRRKLSRHFGPFWPWPRALGPYPTFGWVRCEGAGNFGAFAFRDATLGFFFFEEGTVWVLR